MDGREIGRTAPLKMRTRKKHPRMIVKTTNSVLFRFNKFTIVPKLFRLIIILCIYISTCGTTEPV